VSFAAITLCVASQRVFIVVYFVIDSENFWIHRRMLWSAAFKRGVPFVCILSLRYHLAITVVPTLF